MDEAGRTYPGVAVGACFGDGFTRLNPNIHKMLSQRSTALKDLLSMTMPYRLWEDMTKDFDKSCLATHSWKNIEKRL